MPTRPLTSEALAELVRARISGRRLRSFAREIGANVSVVSKVANGGWCSAETFTAICEALRLKVSWRERKE